MFTVETGETSICPAAEIRKEKKEKKTHKRPYRMLRSVTAYETMGVASGKAAPPPWESIWSLVKSLHLSTAKKPGFNRKVGQNYYLKATLFKMSDLLGDIILKVSC